MRTIPPSRRAFRRSLGSVAGLGLLALSAGTANAQSQGALSGVDQGAGTHSGYNLTSPLEGGGGVAEDLSQDDIRRESLLDWARAQTALQPWFAWKTRLYQNTGLQLSFSYQALGQAASQSLGETRAAAARGQIQGAWELVGRGTRNVGKFTFRVEHRQTAGTEIPPSQLAYQFGSFTSSGTGFSDFGFAVTEYAWRQALLEGKFKFIFGKISAISWYNTHALSSSMRGFQNTAMQSSLSKPAPGRAFGGGIGAQLGEHLVVVAGIHDANGKTTGNPFDTIGAHEFYKSVEVRYHPTTPDRWRWDQIKLQLWHQDARTEAGIPESSGVTFAASHLFNDRWMPFVFGGHSDGKASLLKSDLVAGLGVGFDVNDRAAGGVLGIAAGWGDPSQGGLQDQYTGELFYRFQLLEHLAITPSVQMVIHPAANPTQDRVYVASLRARVTF